MKTILVPTDFSKNADHALQYAIGVAKKTSAKIILLHSYYVPLPSTEVPSVFPAEEIESVRLGAAKQLKLRGAKVSAKDLSCQAINKEGLIADVILETIKSKKANLVIMGTKGARGIKRFILGSNTARVIRDATCPVIAVPEQTKVKQIKKMVFATDHHTGENVSLKKVVDLARIFDASIRLIHITREKEDEKKEISALINFVEKAKVRLRYPKISSQLLYGKNVEKELDVYIEEQHPDLLVMTTYYRTIMEKLFGKKSITRQMVYHTGVPLMVFHTNLKPVVMI